MGKTVTTELATFTPGKTRNPRNLEHTPGGSSSGSAAAVAAGMVPAALGTQTVGSVIRPGAFCGIYGFKPTFGLIPRAGVLTQAPSLDTVGVYGRSVEDLALLADALQGHDERDPASLATSRPRLLATATEDWPLAPLFAFVKTHAWSDADAVDARGLRRARRGAGRPGDGDLASTTPPSAAMPPPGRCRGWRWPLQFGPLLDRAPELLSDNLRQQLEEGRRVSGVEYLAALNAREEFYARPSRSILLDYGTILTPAALGPAPKGLGRHRQPGLLRLLDLSRRAGRDAAAAGGRRPAHGRAADRRAPRRRPPAAHRAMAGEAPCGGKLRQQRAQPSSLRSARA